MQFKSMQEAEDFVYDEVLKTRENIFLGKAGFNKSKRFFNLIGNPQDNIPSIHIAGSSGKGTTLAMIEQGLIAHKFTTACLTSPHVYSLTERCRIRGQEISQDQYLEALNWLYPYYEKSVLAGDIPSYFEINMAIGFYIANQQEVDYLLVETGLGGEKDTSNVINRKDKICVISSIGYDHENILGSDLKSIAAAKAGIIHSGQTVIVSPQVQDVAEVIQRKVQEVEAQLVMVKPDKRSKNLVKINPRLAGRHQEQNYALALATLENVSSRDGWKLDEASCRGSLKNIKLWGRFEITQVKGKTIVYDGAHNQQKLEALMDSLNESFPAEERGTVFVSGADRDGESLAKIAMKGSADFVLSEHHSEMSDMYKPAYNFADFAKKQNISYLLETDDIAVHIMNSKIGLWLVTGSFYFLAKMKKSIEAS